MVKFAGPARSSKRLLLSVGASDLILYPPRTSVLPAPFIVKVKLEEESDVEFKVPMERVTPVPAMFMFLEVEAVTSPLPKFMLLAEVLAAVPICTPTPLAAVPDHTTAEFPKVTADPEALFKTLFP
jgi:hypothetical protein